VHHHIRAALFFTSTSPSRYQQRPFALPAPALSFFFTSTCPSLFLYQHQPHPFFLPAPALPFTSSGPLLCQQQLFPYQRHEK
jgi:hypothetical protein